MKDFEGALVAARSVTKHYGGITALDDVSLEVLPAEIHALVGENGAGKSTLVKVMTGAETADAGDVLIAGEEVGALTPEKARHHGVGAVYQEPSLVPTLTVLENMFLGRERRAAPGVLERKLMKREPRRQGAHGRRADPLDGRPRHRRSAAAQAAAGAGRARGARARVAAGRGAGELRAPCRRGARHRRSRRLEQVSPGERTRRHPP